MSRPEATPWLTLPGDALGALAERVVERTVEVAAVPAPTGAEVARRAVVARWWTGDGRNDVHVDEAGNLWACARPGTGPAVVLAAHLDTVFDDAADHAAVRRDGRLVGPGVGDDAVALAALGEVGRLLAASEGTAPVYLLATVGEEGLGNLAGARHAVGRPRAPLGALVAVEGNYLGRLGTIGVGSRRWRVEIEGPGGHAWEAADAPSAVHVAAELVASLARFHVEPGRSSLNVGRLVGGEAINARARRASFELDVRAAEPGELAAIADGVDTLLAGLQVEGLHVAVVPIGDRPAGRVEPGHPLVEAARAALVAHGVTPREVATSTDANAAHAAGVPAIALGVTTGAGEHTPEEWIDLEPIGVGVLALAETVLRLDALGEAEGGARAGTVPVGNERGRELAHG